jgi:antirestriction protein ArdC
MTTEQAKQLSEDALSQLMDALERGHSEALKTYLSAMSRFHRYSWGNVLLIYSQKPNASHVAGFHSWLKLRRFVRKGEKGIVILAPMVGKLKSKDDEVETDGTKRLFGFRAAHIFDVSQTDGDPLPECASVTGDPEDRLNQLVELVASKGIALVYSRDIAPAHGLSSGGKITLLPDLPAAAHFSVLVHELAHELLHRGDRRGQTDIRIRETEAEAVAFVVSSAIGLETGTASSDYIQLYRGDKHTLIESLDYIQRVAGEILRALDPDGTEMLERKAS